MILPLHPTTMQNIFFWVLLLTNAVILTINWALLRKTKRGLLESATLLADAKTLHDTATRLAREAEGMHAHSKLN